MRFLTLAEAAVFALSEFVPRGRAEEVVKNACATAAKENRPLMDVVARLTEDSLPRNAIDWAALADPKNYLGETGRIIDNVLQHAKGLL